MHALEVLPTTPTKGTDLGVDVSCMVLHRVRVNQYGHPVKRKYVFKQNTGKQKAETRMSKCEGEEVPARGINRRNLE